MSLGSGGGFDTGLWDELGFDVQSASPETAKALTLLVLLMRADKALDIPKGAYYSTFDGHPEFPQVVITFEDVPTAKRGIGWRMDKPKVHVLFRLRSTHHAPQGKLAFYAERLAAILEENPRLGDETGETSVSQAQVASWKPMYGKGADFVEDVADVTVELVLVRRRST